MSKYDLFYGFCLYKNKFSKVSFIRYNPVMKNIKKIILFIILLLIGGTSFIWFYKPDLITVFFQSPEYSRNLYKQARTLQLDNDFRSAYYTYGRISPKYKAYDVVLFKQAQCAAGIEDEKTAIQKYKKLLKSYKNSPFVPMASYDLGRAFLRYNQPMEAEKQFLYTLNNFPGTDYALGSYYFMGELNKEKNRELATEFWLKYIALAPGGKFALNCYEGLKTLDYNFNEKDKKHIGIALFMQQKNKEALFYLDQLPEKEVWYYKAFCHKSIGNRAKAISILKEALKNYLDDSVSTQKIERAMLAYVNLSYDNSYRSWSDILHWTDKAKDFALYQKAQLMSLKKTKVTYEEIVENYSDGNYASEALWNLLWIEYDSGNYDKALKHAQKHITTYKNTKASPAVHFWVGKYYENKNDKANAKEMYKTIMEKFPDSYYAFRAHGRLNAINKGFDMGWETNRLGRLPVEEMQISLPYTYKEIEQKFGPQTAEMILNGDYETAMLFVKDDPFLESWVKYKDGATASSIVAARNAMGNTLDRPDPKDPKWKLIYPIYYPDALNDNAEVNGLDPFLAISLLKEESYFNPYAVSSSNALGLMQVLPGTAKDIIRWKRLGSYCNKALFDPEENIKIGTAYLGHTKEFFDGNMLFSVAAYNAGPAAVKTWTKKLSTDDLDKFVENIPYTQTRDYVKKVFGSYWNYKRVYGER